MWGPANEAAGGNTKRHQVTTEPHTLYTVAIHAQRARQHTLTSKSSNCSRTSFHSGFDSGASSSFQPYLARASATPSTDRPPSAVTSKYSRHSSGEYAQKGNESSVRCPVAGMRSVPSSMPPPGTGVVGRDILARIGPSSRHLVLPARDTLRHNHRRTNGCLRRRVWGLDRYHTRNRATSHVVRAKTAAARIGRILFEN